MPLCSIHFFTDTKKAWLDLLIKLLLIMYLFIRFYLIYYSAWLDIFITLSIRYNNYISYFNI